MANGLIGFGGVDGLGSSCGCSASRRAGMAGFGAGPDGLGAGPDGLGVVGQSGGPTTGRAIGGLALFAAVGGLCGLTIGGYVGSSVPTKSNAARGAAAGAAGAAVGMIALNLISRYMRRA